MAKTYLYRERVGKIMSLYRFNKVENGYYDCSYIEELVNAIDVVFPGIRDICDTSSWVYYPDECDVVDDWGV